MTNKVTETQMLEAIKNALTDVDTEVGVAEMVEYLEKRMGQVAAKADKARERAAEKKAEGDELRETIKNLLTDEWQGADTITALVNKEDVSKQKVIARLSQLVNLGIAEKTQIKEEGTDRKIMGYKIKAAE